MNVLIHTAHVKDGHRSDNASGLLGAFVLIAPCKVVMIHRAEPMHCCNAASYVESLRDADKMGLYSEIMDS